MTTLREAAELTLKALDSMIGRKPEHVVSAITALQTALAPKPVAWMDREGDIYPMPEIEGWAPPHTMLYTAPPQRKPLTTLEIFDLWKPYEGNPFPDKYEFARAIERAHGIGGEE